MIELARPALMLAKREVTRFFRQRSRVVGALGTPLLFWLVIGSGFERSVQTTTGKGYLEYFYTGSLVMMILFTSIFSTISIIEDRNQGFLQGVLSSPVFRFSIVSGKILGVMLIALFQAYLFLFLAPWAGISIGLFQIFWTGIACLCVSFTLTCLGYLIAWRLDSIQGFHGVMNLLLMPMWLLSGSVFPTDKVPAWLHEVMKVNPLTYGTNAIRGALYGDLSQFPTSLAVLTLFGFTMFVLCWVETGKRNR